jgi:hypothetical protein
MTYKHKVPQSFKNLPGDGGPPASSFGVFTVIKYASPGDSILQMLPTEIKFFPQHPVPVTEHGADEPADE